MLITKVTGWSERIASLAVHRLNVILEACRGGSCAQVAAGIHSHSDASRHGHTADPGNIGVRLGAAFPDLKGRRLNPPLLPMSMLKVPVVRKKPVRCAHRDIVRPRGVV